MRNVSRIAIGTVQFGLNYGVANHSGQVPADEVARIIARANEVGLDTLDTAIAYGDAESRLGKVGVAGWKVVTKLPPMPESASVLSWVQSQVNESLARLNVSSLYGLMLHQPAALFSAHGAALFDAMNGLKRDGRVEKIGISAYGPEEIEVVTSRFPIDIVQAPFNVIDRRMHDSGCLAALNRQGIEFHARSIFLQGLLLMEGGARPVKFSRWAGIWGRWESWLTENQLSALEACIAFVANNSSVNKIVVGVDSFFQLDEIIRAANRPLRVAFPAELSISEVNLVNPANWSSS